jgi:cysteine desulfuration protein SufE
MRKDSFLIPPASPSLIPSTLTSGDMSQAAHLPPSIERTLARFRALGREEKMQSLLAYAKKLPTVPDHVMAAAGPGFEIPECQTPLRILPEIRDGRMYYHALIDARQSPTVAAFLSILLGAVNGEPPDVTLAIPEDFVRTVMSSMGLGTREVGLEAIVARLKRYAREAASQS